MTEPLAGEDTGPIVRPYTMTGGRTSAGGARFDLVSVVTAVGEPGRVLPPEHLAILDACRAPASVADVASSTGLAVGVLRVLLADLRDAGLISLRRPAPPAGVPHESLLRDVLAGLRAL
ncbi:DNA-binding transcriptional ArsR family regulator [Streptosporangium becharense]|uniref:DNA-binding transcriptional ArsR family regulator n=1 Tax=Streptosporangium becharense TaxID=1816182 RepID=A0A7W9MGZ1_9ACTN|nr:DUF742 domain-containing protein [Streptosporangium becharense]MBB2909084.1 DNA-binding transcriptional ArsR family regulator [Streptosporangium becharense]MBB5819898.1 DNA-binding transcriptional ArsR family regulator [Streptosporangium becharense]